MGRKRPTTEQIIGHLREAEVLHVQGMKTGEICRRIGISEQTYYRWRKVYSGMKVDQARRLKELEKENARLRRAVSDLTGFSDSKDRVVCPGHEQQRQPKA